jgi:hypothetical protein
MAALTVQVPTVAGLAPSYAAAAGGGDTFVPGSSGTHILHVKNGGGSAITVTVDDAVSVTPGSAKQFDPDIGISVPNGGERMIAIDPARFNNPSTGVVAITYSAVTSVTVGVFRV